MTHKSAPCNIDSPSTRDAVSHLRSLGFAVCKPDAAEKKPLQRGWSTRSLEPNDFADGDQVGMLAGPLSDGGKPGHALIIVDLDAPEAVRLADDYLPATAMIDGRIGKPRSHRYFLTPVATIPDWGRSNAEQGAKAAVAKAGHPGPFLKHFNHRESKNGVLDFLGTGGMAVCPPSVNPSGEIRSWGGSELRAPAVVAFLELWESVCELASACECEIPDVVPRPVVPKQHRPTSSRGSGSSVEERAARYLAKLPGAVAGSKGHSTTLTAARALVWGFDLDIEAAYRMLVAEYNPRCEPRWSERELRHKLEDANRIPFAKPRGHLRDAERPEWSGYMPQINKQQVGVSLPPSQDRATQSYPRPGPGEEWDDPHRVARMFMDRHRTEAGEHTLLQWRDEFHEWRNSSWSAIPDTDLDARIARHTRELYVADLPLRVAEAQHAAEQSGKEAPSKKISLFRVTTRGKADIRLNLSSLANHPDRGDDPPFWLSSTVARDAANVIAAPNGLFTLEDIAFGKPAFADPTPSLFTPTALPFPVLQSPPSPSVWLRCLQEWFNGDESSILGLQEWFGYLISADTSLHKVLFMGGPKRSGKGTITDTLTKLVGPVNTASTTFAGLGENFGLESLLGKRVAIIPDGRLSGRTETAAIVERLLSISGEDAQSVNRKNRRRITTKLRVRFVIASNEIPRLPDASGALASRFHILHTPNSWFGKEDRNLKAKIATELPGILVWAAQGWVRLQQQGAFTQNTAAAQYAAHLADLSSPIQAFVRDACWVGPEQVVEIPTLFAAWRDWNEQRHREYGSEAVFGRDLRAACPQIRDGQPRKDGKRVRVYYGIGMRDRNDWGDDEAEKPGVARDGTRANLTHAWRERAEVIGGNVGESCVRLARVPSRATNDEANVQNQFDLGSEDTEEFAA